VILSLTLVFSMLGATTWAVEAQPAEVLMSAIQNGSSGFDEYTYDVTQTLYPDAYLNIVNGVWTTPPPPAFPLFLPTPFASTFDPDDIIWTDNTPGTLGNVVNLEFYDAFGFGDGLAYEAYFSSYYDNAPTTGPYSVRASFQSPGDDQSADFTFVVTDQNNQDSYNTVVSSINFAFYFPESTDPDATGKTSEVRGNAYYSESHIGRSYVTGFDGLYEAGFENIIDGYTRYFGSDSVESITIDGKVATNEGNEGWQYRVYKQDPLISVNYNIDPLSALIALDDYKLSDNDYVMFKYGNYYDDTLFDDVIQPF
jgi:hypothetical protein